MTTTHSAGRPVPPAAPFRLPDIPERHPDDMTSVDSLHRHGAIANIVQYLGHPETTIVSAEHYVVPGPVYVPRESRYPDLLVAFDVNPAAYAASNGYIVTDQSKPPDFVLEVGSRRSAGEDLGEKKDYYELLGVGEYWLFDSEGEFYGFTLRGYRLEGRGYGPIELDEIRPGVLQGHSAALNLNLRAEHGYLGWHDPATGEHIPTLQSQTARIETAEGLAEAERAARVQETARAEAERAARISAEARAQELEAEVLRLREGR